MKIPYFALLLLAFTLPPAFADENLFGYVKGVETLPYGAFELYQVITTRDDKGKGTYHAVDYETELEYGVTDRLSASAALQMQSVHVTGLVINGYVPKDHSSGLQPSGVEAEFKYNFLSPVKEPVGLSTNLAFEYAWLDKHSGQAKQTRSMKLALLLQKNFLDDQLVWVTNFSMESTYAKRKVINDLPATVEWSTTAEIEIEPSVGTGINYRFFPGWFAGVEGIYETEFETEVDRERFSLFVGPSLHYASQSWWATLTYLKQISGGGERYDEQTQNLHLIEKTTTEARLKVGFNF